MDIDYLIEQLLQMQKNGKGQYKVLAHNIEYIENDGEYYVEENKNIELLFIDDSAQTITFGKYFINHLPFCPECGEMMELNDVSWNCKCGYNEIN
jgi:ribosomal protein S27AE